MRSMVFATGVVLILQVAASLAQQSPSPPNERAHKVYVMTGCLERGSAQTSVLQLTDSTPSGQAPPADPSTTDAGAVAGNRSYDLLPVSSVSEQGINRETLESHVGDRVEVTVRPVETSIAPATRVRRRPRRQRSSNPRRPVTRSSRSARCQGRVRLRDAKTPVVHPYSSPRSPVWLAPWTSTED